MTAFSKFALVWSLCWGALACILWRTGDAEQAMSTVAGTVLGLGMIWLSVRGLKR